MVGMMKKGLNDLKEDLLQEFCNRCEKFTKNNSQISPELAKKLITVFATLVRPECIIPDTEEGKNQIKGFFRLLDKYIEQQLKKTPSSKPHRSTPAA